MHIKVVNTQGEYKRIIMGSDDRVESIGGKDMGGALLPGVLMVFTRVLTDVVRNILGLYLLDSY